MKKKCVAIGIILMFIGTCLIPTSAVKTEQSSQPISREHWLYVGGSGPGNYTKIQDAIDNATDGDTVYVYDDSSPYYENIMINSSIHLLGENTQTTIINGTTNDTFMNLTLNIGVYITANKVTLQGFTIQGCNFTGIGINSNNNSITDNILEDNYNGIGIGYGGINQTSPQLNNDNLIRNNVFIRDTGGIYVAGGKNNIIEENVFFQNGNSIAVVMSMNTNISYNVISEGANGVLTLGSYNTILFKNNITNNENIGVYTVLTSADKILQNNFIGNNKSAVSFQIFLLRILLFKKEVDFPIRRNVWNENYWDGPRTLPYKIPGWCRVKFQIDWHPAQEPYDI